jgi:hypothetical protein
MLVNMDTKTFDEVLREVKYPIPMRQTSGDPVNIKDLPFVTTVHFDGDSHCIWVADRESARALRGYGFGIVTDPDILAKQKAYLNNEDLCRKYPFWLDK